jgi:thioredoxin reductase (NADPH)
METHDALVIGGGPAGLAGALYLARFKRSVLVVDAGDSRAVRIPRSHNVAGFTEGVVGEELIDSMRRQVQALGVHIVQARVERIEAAGDAFRVLGPDGWTSARTILLASGASDVEPAIPDIQLALDQGALRYCPVCDGFEVSDRNVGVLCKAADAGVSEALYLRHFTPLVSLFVTSASVQLDADQQRRLAEAGITLYPEPATRLALAEGDVIVTTGGQQVRCDSLYSALGMKIHNELALALGAEIDEDGYVLTDRHQETTVPGLYSAGDVARGLNQISVAIGAAATAASAMHLRLSSR